MSSVLSCKTSSPEETFQLGARLASELRRGDLVLLTGSLGAGKTCLARGIASAMNLRGHVSSPTFTLLHLHEPLDPQGIPLHHFDVYRLEKASDFLENGLDEYTGGQAITLIEWGDRVRSVLTDPAIEIRIESDPQIPEGRLFTFSLPPGRVLDLEEACCP